MPGPKGLRHPVAFPELRYCFLRIRFQHRQQILETDGDEEENPHTRAQTSTAASGLIGLRALLGPLQGLQHLWHCCPLPLCTTRLHSPRASPVLILHAAFLPTPQSKVRVRNALRATQRAEEQTRAGQGLL